jgi:DNA-binding NtrC family response regulator
MEQREARTPCIYLVSEDAQLAMALTAVIGPEFVLVVAPRDGTLWRAGAGAEAVILDLDSLYRVSTGHQASDWLARGLKLTPVVEAYVSCVLASGVPVVVMAGDDLRSHAQDLVARGAYNHVRNPPALRDLKALLTAACESRRLKKDLESTRHLLDSSDGLDKLTGASAPMQLVYKLVRKVANLDASVLISGESGTGKELISRAIHNTGNRAKRPFVAVSCSAIPDALIEAELFGHEKGAFTGTIGTREGYFEKAGDGTLFLDEIGELKPQTQVKLLRVLQEREFSRLGSSRSIPLRARILLATHRDLGRMVAEGQFRQDLFYRVNVLNIVAPELRRRSSDIPVLAQHFLIKYSEWFRKPVETIDPEAVTLLQRYTWPGNVRELENVIQRAIILAEGYSLQVSDLPEEIQAAEASWLGEDDMLPNGSFECMLREFKIKLATEAVQQCKGNKTMAAQSLSISRAYLHRLLRPVMSAAEANVTEIRSHVCA